MSAAPARDRLPSTHSAVIGHQRRFELCGGAGSWLTLSTTLVTRVAERAIISPVGSYLPRYLAHGGEYFDQEWMGDGTPLDTAEGRADEILDAINHNLRGGPNGDAGIDHLFFAHNDIPYVAKWNTKEQNEFLVRGNDKKIIQVWGSTMHTFLELQ